MASKLPYEKGVIMVSCRFRYEDKGVNSNAIPQDLLNEL